MIADWDDAYANAPHIPTATPGRRAGRRRRRRSGRRSRPTGGARGSPTGRIRASGSTCSCPRRGRGLVVYMHGGYWRAFDRTDWSHLAAGALGRGWAVAMAGYPLAPEVRIASITRSVAAAVEAAAATVDGPVGLVGHSAGGHLVARQVCTDSGLSERTRARVRQVTAISGLHDLRPLLRLTLNDTLRLDADEAAAESPALRLPWPGVRIRTWVGGIERPEFQRQSALLANVWTGVGAETTATVAPGRHHFDVIGALEDPASGLVGAVLGEAP